METPQEPSTGKDKLGRLLREHFEKLGAEPIPGELMQLIERLDKSTQPAEPAAAAVDDARSWRDSDQ